MATGTFGGGGASIGLQGRHNRSVAVFAAVKNLAGVTIALTASGQAARMLEMLSTLQPVLTGGDGTTSIEVTVLLV